MDQSRAVNNSVSNKYNFRSIIDVPGIFRYYTLTITEEGNYGIKMHVEGKPERIQPFPHGLIRRKQEEEQLTAIALSAFISINSILNWLYTAISPFSIIASSVLQ